MEDELRFQHNDCIAWCINTRPDWHSWHKSSDYSTEFGKKFTHKLQLEVD